LKTFITCLLTVFTFSAISQNHDFENLLKNGKSEFYKEFDKQDYAAAVANLEKAVLLEPDSAEAHYFLGYAYSRLNSKDGKGIVNMNRALTLKCSNEFETVNRLQPHYTGETLALDPWSKITAEWGSLAMCYINNNKADSALWAFSEGKKRGGFSTFFLSVNKAVLDRCSKNSILISSGDNFTIPLWYLQFVENYRTDVAVIDISLLNTDWYPRLLADKGIATFDLSAAVLDTIDYCQWEDSKVTIGKFAWKIAPSYYEHYLLRGDRIFLSLLRKNNFQRDVFFTTAFNEDARLSLKEHLQSKILVDKLITKKQKPVKYAQYKADISKVLELGAKTNLNCDQEINFMDLIRYNIIAHASEYLINKKNKQAQELIDLMDASIDERKIPYQDIEVGEYVEQMRAKLKK